MVGVTGKNGGPRPGAGRKPAPRPEPEPQNVEVRSKPGRPPGAQNLRVGTATAWALVREGRSPLDVMLKNMLYWHQYADSWAKELESMVVKLEEPEDIKAAMQLLNRMLAAREQAQKCAVDAAPYVHARIAAMVPMDDTDKKVKITLKIGDIPVQVETSAAKPFTVIEGAAPPRVPVNDGDD